MLRNLSLTHSIVQGEPVNSRLRNLAARK